MRYILTSCLLIMFLFCNCTSHTKNNPTDEMELENANVKFNIINHGTGHTLNEHVVTDTSDPMGVSSYGSDFIIDTVTDTIQARQGVEFGITYSITANISGTIPLTKVWVFPDTMQLSNGRKINRLVNEVSEDLNSSLYSCYRLDSSYEVMKGVWHLRFYYKHHLLVYKTFVLI